MVSHLKAPCPVLRALNAQSCFRYLPLAWVGFLLCSFLPIFPASFTSKGCPSKALLKTLWALGTVPVCDPCLSCSFRTGLSSKPGLSFRISHHILKAFCYMLMEGKIPPEGTFLFPGREIRGWQLRRASRQSLRGVTALVFGGDGW